MGIGEKVRKLREIRGWKQGTLAERAGISQTHLSQIERGQIPTPHWSTIESLLEALNVNPQRMIKNLLQKVDLDTFLQSCQVELESVE